MKIKHIQGYGCVNAKKIKQTDNLLVVEVRGEHEYGLCFEDKYDVFNWLVKKFDKKHKYTDYLDIHDLIVNVDYVDNPKCYTGREEICTYNIYFKEK